MNHPPITMGKVTEAQHHLREVVLTATLADFEAWLVSKRGSGYSFSAGDPCGCPMAVWLAERGGKNWSDIPSVSDDFVHDGNVYIADSPTWISMFVLAIDHRFGRGTFTVAEFEPFFATIKPILEQATQ